MGSSRTCSDVAVALLLIAAALLKAHEFATHPAAEMDVFTSKVASVWIVQLELLV